MERQMRRRTVLASGVAGLAGVTGCLGNTSTELPGAESDQSKDRTVKLGVLAPQSGSLETFGSEFVDAAKLVKRQVEVSDSDFSIDLAVKDTESDPGAAASAAKELVDEGYETFIGPGSQESANQVSREVLAPESVVAMSPLAAGNMKEFDEEDRLFSTAPSTSKLSLALTRLITIERTESVAVVHTDNEYGNRIGTSTKEGIETRGIDVKAQIGIENLEASSHVSKLEEAMADDPGALVVASDPVTGVQLLKDFYREFESRPVFLTDRLRLRNLPSQVGSEMESARAVSLRPWWGQRMAGDEEEEGTEDGTPAGEDAELLAPFFDAFRTAYNRPPTMQAGQAFDATAVLALAVIAAGEDSYEGDEIRKRIREVANRQASYQGVRGFGADDYWKGLSPIADGVRNDYRGSIGQVEFDSGTGDLEASELQVARFAPDDPSGFEEVIPIPL